MEVVITGGTGMVGKALTRALISKGYKVCILSRNKRPRQETDGVRFAHWDVSGKIIDPVPIRSADHIIHLAGAGVADRRWTKQYKGLILSSRVDGSRLLSDAINEHATNLKSLVCASATGWYGADKTGHIFTEEDPAANDFLGDVCRQWESAIEVTSCPVSHLRTGIVLNNNGGAYPKLTTPVRYGIAPILGNGKQVVSWIHIDDLVRLYIAAMENNWEGSFNAVSPTPVTNRFLITESAKQLKGKFFIRLFVPAFMLRLIAGESAEEVLKSCTVSCNKVKSAGFTFLYPTLHSCLPQLTKSEIRI